MSVAAVSNSVKCLYCVGGLESGKPETPSFTNDGGIYRVFYDV